jgi:hypothetical protein
LTPAALLGLVTLFILTAVFAIVAALLAWRFGRVALWIVFAVFTAALTAVFTASASRVPGGAMTPTVTAALAALATFGIPALVVAVVLHVLLGRAERPSVGKLLGYGLAALVVAVPLGAAASYAADAAGTVGPPPPAPWVRVMKNPRADVLLDTSRLERTAWGTRVWIRVNETVPEGGPGGYDRVEMREEVDCPNRRAKDMHVQVSMGNGPLIKSMDVSPQVWRGFDVHPLGEPLLDGACDRLSEAERHAL